MPSPYSWKKQRVLGRLDRGGKKEIFFREGGTTSLYWGIRTKKEGTTVVDKKKGNRILKGGISRVLEKDTF